MSGNSLFKNFFYKFILSFFNLIIPVLIIPYIYRILGPEKIGMIEYSNSLFMYFFLIGGLGIYSYGMREVSAVRGDKEKIGKLFSSLFVISAGSNGIALAAYLLFAWFRPHDGVTPLLFILGFSFISNVFYIEWLNEAFENFRFITVKTIIVRICSIAVILLLVHEPHDYWVYLAASIGYTFINNIVSFLYIRRQVPFDFSSLRIRMHIRPLLYITVMNNGWVLYGQLDRVFLGKFSSLNEVAYYGAASKIVDILFPLLMSVVAVAGPRLSYYLYNEKDRFAELVKKISSLSIFIILPSAAGIFMLSDEIMFILGGNKFAAASPVLKLFAVYMIILTAERILSNNILFIYKKERVLNVMIIGFGLVNLAVKAMMSGRLTAVTALAATAVIHGALTIVQNYYASRHLGICPGFFNRSNLLYLALSLCFIPLITGVQFAVHNMFVAALLSVILCALLYVSVLMYARDRNMRMIYDKALGAAGPFLKRFK